MSLPSDLPRDLVNLPMSSPSQPATHRMTPSPAKRPAPARRKQRPTFVLATFAVGFLGLGMLGFALKGTGFYSWVRTMIGMGRTRTTALNQPVVDDKEMSPRDCSTGVDPGAPIVLPLNLPNGPVNPATLNDDSVSIFRVDTHQRVPAHVKLFDGAIRITPLTPLEANHNYRVHLLPGVKDVKGQEVLQKSLAFFTSAKAQSGVAFEPVALGDIAKGNFGYDPAAGDPRGFKKDAEAFVAPPDPKQVAPTFSEGFTCLEFGPDGKLYASTDHGKIVRFTVNADGTLANREEFTTIQEHQGGMRLVTGFCFDPKSTADDMTIYATSSEFGFGFPGPVTDFSGKLAKLSGPKFANYELLITNLPRSARDHATNQGHFGPDGALYFSQPSNTATGGADATWFNRQEHLLNASILRLDLAKLKPGQTLDAMTKDVDTFNDKNGNGVQDKDETEHWVGHYDPYASGAPLTIYACGIRMPYDFLWHSNGHLYTAVNGASSGGATPAGPNVRGIAKVSLTEHDWLFRIDKPGQYCGHPNPAQGTFVLNGGNPTAAPDFDEVSDYPVGTQPDSGWTPAIYDFGMHVSADGTIEYKSDTFNGALKGKMIVCRFTTNQDLIVLGLDANGEVNEAITGIPGTTNLEQPLDLAEDVRTGNLYVAEYGAARGLPPRITLLRAIKH